MTTKQSKGKRDSLSPTQTKTFQERVEEHKLWSDDQTFKSHEYERRRIEKIQKKGVLKADKHLKRARAFYLPSVMTVLAGTALLLYSTVDALGGEDAPLIKNGLLVKAFGGILTGLGLLALMATAAYTYHREDKVRKRNGYPTLFESSRVKGGGSILGIHQRQSIAAVQEFVDRRAATGSHRDSTQPNGVRRMVSEEESGRVIEPLLLSVSTQLRESSSSASSTLSWLNRHGSHFHKLDPLLKRQSSDSALDQSFARSRVHTPELSREADRVALLHSTVSKEKKSQILNENQNSIGKTRIRCKGCLKMLPSFEQHSNEEKVLFKQSHNFNFCECENEHSISKDEGGKFVGLQQTNLHDHPGVSVCSTDSSGYTGSECNYVIHKELNLGTNGTTTFGIKPDAAQPAAWPTIPSTLIHSELCEEMRQIYCLQCQHPCEAGNQPCRQELNKHPKYFEELMRMDCDSCGKSQVLISTAAVHATRISKDYDSASLSPPVSPNISALPYLSTNSQLSSSGTKMTTPRVPELLSLVVPGGNPIVSTLRE